MRIKSQNRLVTIKGMKLGEGETVLPTSSPNAACFSVPCKLEAQRVPAYTACWKGCFRDVAPSSP